MSQGNRSPRVLRVASHIDEEEQTEKNVLNSEISFKKVPTMIFSN